MEQLHRLSPTQRGNLVAYLDGELDEGSSQEIEQALAVNPIVRHEVELLRRTWEMLDALPREQASDDFTARTLTAIAAQDAEEPLIDDVWIDRTRSLLVWVGWISGMVVAAVLGFLITYQWIPREADPLLRDLPVIEKLDIYSEINDADYLRRLRKSGAFHEQLHPKTED